MTELTLLLGLVLLSVAAWCFVLFQLPTFQRWWYTAGDKAFLKNPTLDIGLLFLIGIANIAVFSMLLTRSTDSTSAQSQPPPNASTVDNVEAPGTVNPSENSQTDNTGIATPSQSKSQPSTKTTVDGIVSSSPWRMVLSGITSLAVILLIVKLSQWCYGSKPSMWGLGALTSGKFIQTVRFAILGFFLLVPAVLLIHLVLSTWIVYQHNTINQIQELRDLGRWDWVAVIFFQTALIVPIVEEFGFRVILQGFAEQWLRRRGNFYRIVLGPLRVSVAQNLGLAAAAEVANQDPPTKRPKPTLDSTVFWGPIVFSSLLFAFAHAGQGAAPISLYFLAMGLGFLYKTTGNISVCILIHILLNSFSLSSQLMFK